MTCKQTQRLLPGLVDDALVAGDAQAVQTHVETCEHCSGVLVRLRRERAILLGLPEVEPPPWFATKVMARVREEAGARQGWWRRLFHPWHVKVPIQALAVLVVAVVAVQVYRTTGPQREFAEQREAFPSKAPAPLPQPTQPIGVPRGNGAVATSGKPPTASPGPMLGAASESVAVPGKGAGSAQTPAFVPPARPAARAKPHEGLAAVSTKVSEHEDRAEAAGLSVRGMGLMTGSRDTPTGMLKMEEGADKGYGAGGMPKEAKRTTAAAITKDDSAAVAAGSGAGRAAATADAAPVATAEQKADVAIASSTFTVRVANAALAASRIETLVRVAGGVVKDKLVSEGRATMVVTVPEGREGELAAGVRRLAAAPTDEAKQSVTVQMLVVK